MVEFKTVLLAASAALALTGTPANAQDKDMIDTFAMGDLEMALGANGAKWEDIPDDNSINVTFSNGLYANAVLMACEDSDALKNCYGTSMLATFEWPENASDAEVQKGVAEYNYRNNFGRAYVDPEGILSVRMYIISDGGITRENYRRQIQLWASSLEKFPGYFPESE